MRIIQLLLLVAGLSSASTALAYGGMGGHGLQFGLIFMSPSQNDLDGYIDRTNATNSTSISKFGSAYEFYAGYTYRFQGSIFALHFRPSYFTSSTDGSGADLSLTGFTFYPMLRFYPLENNFIHFFMQVGVGYGNLNGEVKQSSGKVTFNGDAFGAIGGLGAEFCFTDSHCMAVEGNLRYLPIHRNVVKSSSGSLPDFSQSGSGQELEYNGSDLKTNMSGIQGAISYIIQF